jgi:hypothetical protein
MVAFCGRAKGRYHCIQWKNVLAEGIAQFDVDEAGFGGSARSREVRVKEKSTMRVSNHDWFFYTRAVEHPARWRYLGSPLREYPSALRS